MPFGKKKQEDAKVAFCCAGVMKGGTTALYKYLAEHPQVILPPGKEVNYFNDGDRKIDWSAPDYSMYHAAWPEVPGRIRGDMTPSYLFRPYAIDRMAEYNPKMKIILIFRDPVKRAYSHWKQISMCDCACGVGNCAWVKEELSFTEAIRTDRGPPSPPPEPFLAHCSRDGYVKMGLYGVQVRKVLEVFPRDQVLFLRSDDLDLRPSETLVRVCRFLGLQPFPWDLPRLRVHEGYSGSGVACMTNDDEQYLRALYKDDLSLFSDLSGLDVSDWIDPKAAAANRPEERKVEFVIAGERDTSSTLALLQFLQELDSISLAPSFRAPAIKGHQEWMRFGLPSAPPLTTDALLEQRECHFFDMPPDVKGDGRNYEQHVYRYHGMFDPDHGGIRGEFTSDYFYCKPALRRMHEYNPNMKIIVIFSDPVQRAYNQWKREVAGFVEGRTFAACIRESVEEQQKKDDYVGRGMYGKQVEFALTVFPRDQFLFLRSEDLRDTPRQTLVTVCEFLGASLPADDGKDLRIPEVMPGTENREAKTDDDIGYLCSIYKDDMALLQKLSGLDVSDWAPMK
jgi:hypothetical protein